MSERDPVDHFQRAGESLELLSRYFAARPYKGRNVAVLKARREKGDPNVVPTYEDGVIVRYQLEFTKRQREELGDAYLSFHPRFSESLLRYQLDNLKFDSKVFIGIIESWGDSFDLFEAAIPDDQKNRTRAMKPIAIALLKLDEALSELDTDALAYWYAHVSAALPKLQPKSASANDITDAKTRLAHMLDDPLRTAVEALELRNEMREAIGRAVEATEMASSTLPKCDHVQSNTTQDTRPQ
jgi:hypothetical protein